MNFLIFDFVMYVELCNNNDNNICAWKNIIMELIKIKFTKNQYS